MSDTDTDTDVESNVEAVAERSSTASQASPDDATKDKDGLAPTQGGVDNGHDGAFADPETDVDPVTAEPTEAGAPIETFDAPSGIQLLEGEEVLHDLRPSWGNYSKSLWLGVLTFWTVVGCGFFLYPLLARRQERYVITTERVIHRSGLMSTTTNEYRIADVRGLQTGQSFTEKLFGSGTLKFTAAGGAITFPGVPDAPQVANTIRRQKAELE